MYKKTKQEVIDFIDSKKAVTQRELLFFYYNDVGRRINKNKMLLECWVYALKKFGYKKLADYREHKINNHFEHREKAFLKIYKTDKRFKEIGYKKARKILLNVYGLSYGLTTIGRYYRKLKTKQ